MAPDPEDDGLQSDGLQDDDGPPVPPPAEQPAPATPSPTPPVQTRAAVMMQAARRPRARFSSRSKSDSETPLEEWALSYSDMVTLLLTMFIALSLIASSEERPGKGGGQGGEAAAGAETGSGGMRGIVENLLRMRIASPYDDEVGFTTVEVNDTETPSPGADLAVIKAEDLARIEQRQEALATIRTKLRTQQLDQFITADVEGDGIRLNIPNSILFASGAAELQDRGPVVLRALKPVLDGGNFGISVEGHTDDIPISTEKFPSNWELSAQRAATVVRALADAGIAPQRLEAVGYAETRPLTENSTEDGRKENRRVSLFLRM